MIILLLQRQQQPCEASLHHVTDTGACPPVHQPASRAVSSRMHGSAAAHFSGRSPSLVAMERVMPKYASWASSDVNMAPWQLGRDRKNVISGYSPLVQTALASRSGRPSALPGHQLPPTSSAVHIDSMAPADLQNTVNVVSPSAVTMSGTASVRSAKDELRARLSHRPASSNSTLRHLSQLGKASFVTYTPSLLSICNQNCDNSQ